MKLEQQVVSLELAKRLKELGVKQESLFYWQGADKNGYIINFEKDLFEYDCEKYSAFTVAELGEMLMPLIPVPINKKWQAPSPKDQTIRIVGYLKDTTEADARAKMLIYLLENNLLK